MHLVPSAVGKDKSIAVVQVPADKAEDGKGPPHLYLL